MKFQDHELWVADLVDLARMSLIHALTHQATDAYCRRRAFTFEEDEFLAEYLAMRIPENGAGGRSGNGVYKELEEQGWTVSPHYVSFL